MKKELSNNVKRWGLFCIFAGIRSNSNIKNKLKQLMSNSKISAAAFADTKPHYDLLDGLRGVAALMVIFYHGIPKPLRRVLSTNDLITGI